MAQSRPPLLTLAGLEKPKPSDRNNRKPVSQITRVQRSRSDPGGPASDA